VANAALLGLNFGVIQYLSVHQEEQRPDLVRGVLRTSLVVTALTGVVAGAAVWLAADFLAIRVFSKPELAQALRIVALAIPFETMNQNLSAGFRGLRRFRDHVMVSDLWRNALALTAVLVLSLRKVELVPVLWVLVLGTAAATLIGLWRMREALAGDVDGTLNHHAARLIRFSYLLIGWNLFQQLAGRGLLLLSGIFLSSADVGILSAFTRLLLLFTFFQSGINQTTPSSSLACITWGPGADATPSPVSLSRSDRGNRNRTASCGRSTGPSRPHWSGIQRGRLVAGAAGRCTIAQCGDRPRGRCSLPATGSVKCSLRRSLRARHAAPGGHPHAIARLAGCGSGRDCDHSAAHSDSTGLFVAIGASTRLPSSGWRPRRRGRCRLRGFGAGRVAARGPGWLAGARFLLLFLIAVLVFLKRDTEFHAALQGWRFRFRSAEPGR
jgi:hypothetical protein